ncbi:hypothetical protein BJ508DRAFT_139714 [Ascobolus immersus RN42]|uniref:Secreted protein n=1 Tax=Ascobolus immersus RN42 TaxID=1160509 RepID=A0A3N4I0Q8_ASCIM|nr:hypothetical protein BJ508DRAFT_139714 [Ascobolus immersus RN42]
MLGALLAVQVMLCASSTAVVLDGSRFTNGDARDRNEQQSGWSKASRTVSKPRLRNPTGDAIITEWAIFKDADGSFEERDACAAYYECLWGCKSSNSRRRIPRWPSTRCVENSLEKQNESTVRTSCNANC